MRNMLDSILQRVDDISYQRPSECQGLRSKSHAFSLSRRLLLGRNGLSLAGLRRRLPIASVLEVRFGWELVDPPTSLDDVKKASQDVGVNERRAGAEDDELGFGASEADVNAAPVLQEVADLSFRPLSEQVGV